MTILAKRSSRTKPLVSRRGKISNPLDTWRRRFLIGIVMAYASVLILAPLASLVSGAFAKGISAVLSALSQPDVFAAFKLTLYIAFITVVVHALFGTMLAWILVRYD